MMKRQAISSNCVRLMAEIDQAFIGRLVRLRPEINLPVLRRLESWL